MNKKVYVVLMHYEQSSDVVIYDDLNRAKEVYNEMLGKTMLYELEINNYNSQVLLNYKN